MGGGYRRRRGGRPRRSRRERGRSSSAPTGHRHRPRGGDGDGGRSRMAAAAVGTGWGGSGGGGTRYGEPVGGEPGVASRGREVAARPIMRGGGGGVGDERCGLWLPAAAHKAHKANLHLSLSRAALSMAVPLPRARCRHGRRELSHRSSATLPSTPPTPSSAPPLPTAPPPSPGCLVGLMAAWRGARGRSLPARAALPRHPPCFSHRAALWASRSRGTSALLPRSAPLLPSLRSAPPPPQLIPHIASPVTGRRYPPPFTPRDPPEGEKGEKDGDDVGHADRWVPR